MFFLRNNAVSMDCTDKGSFRGFMIDAPRATETMDYYFRLINFLHEEKFNSIIFRLTDDEGSAYLFSSHPELNMCEGAFTARELRKLVKYAQKRGIEMIPEIESFGHSKYITLTERYKFLNDGPEGAHYNALCPVNDSSLALMKDLYTEVASIFPSQYIHIGCDEVDWRASEMSKKALATKSKHQIWAEYVNKLNGCLKAIGKKTILWGDVPIRDDNEILDLLDKDIVLIDWNYWETDKAKIESVAHTVINKGFQLIACPALNWAIWGPRVGENQFKNINAYAEVYGKLDSPNNLGIILSHWVPTRYLQNSQWDTYTIGAKILENDGNYDYMDAIPAFVKKHFGGKFDANWEKIYRTIYMETSCKGNGNWRFSPWYSKEAIKSILVENKKLQNRLSELINLLPVCHTYVNKNKKDFDDFRLTIEFMEYNYNRQNELLDFASSQKTDLESVEAYLKRVSSEDQALLSKINSAWSVGRRCNPDITSKEYMWSFYKASDYSKYLSENPSEFIRILKERN